MSEPAEPPGIEVTEGRAAEVGDFRVHRVLPYRARRTVGSWCFVDLMGPGAVTAERGLDIGPHPHIGLQTVTWLLHGEVLHRDSLGSEQVIRPGQLNLMTAGAGVSHSEETRGVYDGTLQGVQLWVALPDATRFGAPAFEHHFELPRVELDEGHATVLVGELAGITSPARRDTDHVGADLDLQPGTSIVPVAPTHEHAVAVIQGTVSVDGTVMAPGRLGYLAPGRHELSFTTDAPARVLLLGGLPFPDQLVMWWNYVARTRGEVTEAHHSWVGDDGRFGTVHSPLDRIVIDDPPWAS